MAPDDAIDQPQGDDVPVLDHAAEEAPQPEPEAPEWPLDERKYRRGDFVPGEPVVLADGQEWQLRRPLVAFEPHDSPLGFRACLSLGDDDSYQGLLDAHAKVYETEGADRGLALIGTEMALARRLLLSQYDLTSGQVARLIKLGYDPDENPRASAIREAIMDVAEGRGPKGPSADGDGSSPMPSADSPGGTA